MYLDGANGLGNLTSDFLLFEKCLLLSFSTLQDLTGDAVKTETKKTVIKSKLREIMRTVGYLFI